MNWDNVFLIFRRELRDQLRDRRTLFTVVVLPLMLYPLIGMALLQLAQFMREHPTRVWLVGSEQLAASPEFLDGDQIDSRWLGREKGELVDLVLSDEADQEFHQIVSDLRNRDSKGNIANLLNTMVQQEMRRRDLDLTILVPPQFELPKGDQPTHRRQKIYLFTNSAVINPILPFNACL